MKYCAKCGKQLFDEAVICPGCGCATEMETETKKSGLSGLKTASKIMMILGTVFLGLYILPLAWCIPMTVAYCNKLKNNQPVSTAFKVCSLLFVNSVAGILMLCDNDREN